MEKKEKPNQIISARKNLYQHEKDRQKPKKSLADYEREARRVGLSYGQYMAYLQSGYLDTYLANRMQKKGTGEKVNVIQSNIIGA